MRSWVEKIFPALFFVALALFSPSKAFGASLFVSPAAGSFVVGQNFAVAVAVGSADRALNAAAGTVIYPADKLEVVSVNKSNSVLSYWITEPSAAAGQIKFEGVVPNPGFTGAAGTLLNITFRVRATGQALVNFSSGSVLANDGLGTEILTAMPGASFSLLPQVTTPPAPQSTVPATYGPPAPEVTSSTHPDPNRWYANSDPVFSWPVSGEITGVNFLANRESTANPGTNSDGLMKTYQYRDVADGEWFFHLRLRDAGGWGGITHFGFNIDTEKPTNLKVKLAPRSDDTDPRIAALVSAQDRTSGLDRYEFSLNNGAPVTWTDDGQGEYRFVVSEPGHQVLVVKVYDLAGNYLQESVEFDVAPLDPPRFTEYPPSLADNTTLAVAGETYPDAQVFIKLEPEQGDALNYEARSDHAGRFSLTVDRRLKEGVYRLSAYVVDERGARSNYSAPIVIPVTLSPFWKFGFLANNVLSIIIPALAMLFLIIFLIWYSWLKMSGLRRRVRKESREAEEALHQAFDLLRADIAEGIERLELTADKRELTREEKQLLRQFRKSLDEAERFVRKEIVDIEREVE